LLRSQEVAKEVSKPLLGLTSNIIKADFPILRRDIHTKDLITSVFHCQTSKTPSFPLENLFGFVKSLLKWDYFKDDVLQHVLNLCQAMLYEGVNEEAKKEIVWMLTEVVVAGCVNDDYGADIESKKGLFEHKFYWICFVLLFVQIQHVGLTLRVGGWMHVDWSMDGWMDKLIVNLEISWYTVWWRMRFSCFGH